MPTIRSSDKGSKKRYAGLAIDSQGKQSLIFKGLETVRTDWTQLARDFQRELYRKIFYNEPYIDYIRELATAIKAGQYDKELVYRKRIRRPLSHYRKNIPPHVQAAKKAEKHLHQSGLRSRYQRGGWIRYVMTVTGPEALEYQQSPLDYDSYIQRQIQPIADGILHFYDMSFTEIVNQQIGLFDEMT